MPLGRLIRRLRSLRATAECQSQSPDVSLDASTQAMIDDLKQRIAEGTKTWMAWKKCSDSWRVKAERAQADCVAFHGKLLEYESTIASLRNELDLQEQQVTNLTKALENRDHVIASLKKLPPLTLGTLWAATWASLKFWGSRK